MTHSHRDNNNQPISYTFAIINLLCLGLMVYGFINDTYIYVWLSLALAIVVLTIYAMWKNIVKKAPSSLSKTTPSASRIRTTNYFNEYVNEELFNNINASIHSFEEFFYALIFSTDDFYNWLSAQSRPMPDEYDVHHSARLMMMADIQSGFKSMYCSQDMTSKEGLAKYMMINFLDKEEYIEYKNIRHISKESLSSATDWGITASNIFNKEQNLDKLVLSDLLQLFNKDLQLQYLIILYRFFSIAAKTDGVVTPDETVYLGGILEHARNIAESEETLNKLLEVKYSYEGKKSIHITHRNNYNFKDIARWVVEKQEIDTLEIQHKFSLEHYQTLKIIDKLEKEGIVSQSNKEGIRFVLVSSVGQLERQWDTNSNNSSVVEKEINAKSNLSQLNELIGLNSVKKDVRTLSNYIKIQQEREKNGLKSSSVSYHCVFTGNPGTGKTTVARILAKIYKDLGVVNKGHLVETDRAGLVAEYVGQTAVKTNKIIDSALDGVLFIDEAYSLAEGGSSDYGSEAIATLLKRMEDDRDRLIVIVAGYTENMKHFINSNPGLQSRFTRYIDFPDYSADELMQIFEMQMSKYDYHFGEGAKEKLQKILDMAIIHKDENFGNGRFVRNVFESILQRQADRLASMGELTSEQLSRIEKEDLADL